MRRFELWGWLAIAIVLSALTIPWFLWGNATIVAGLPLWLWWHVGWMLLASIVFWLFAKRAWGIGIETSRDDASGSVAGHGRGPDTSASGGESR